jgi:hypothetical protein
LRPVVLGDLTLLPDEREARYRRARITGPVSVLLRGACGLRERGRTLVVEGAGDRALLSGTRVRLEHGQRLEVRCERR